jgi:hypothetical protein
MRLPDLRLSLALSSMRRGRRSTTGDGLGAVMDGGDAFFVGAMTTAEEFAASLRAVPDDFAPAMIALGRQSMDGALETIKVMGDAVHDYFDRFVVLVSANLTTSHNAPLNRTKLQ